MPIPNPSLFSKLSNRLFAEELVDDTVIERNKHEQLFLGLNCQQRESYEAIIHSVYNNEGRLIFFYGHGATGKTYLWNTIIAKLRSESKIVLPVATYGTVALLLPGGGTAHSRFHLPLSPDSDCVCSISKGTQVAELL